MENLYSLLDYYFYLGVFICFFNILLSYLTKPSFQEAAAHEAQRCGADAALVAGRSTWHNLAWALFFWPVGVARTLLRLFGW